MKFYLSLLCLLFSVHYTCGQGNRRLRHIMALPSIYRDCYAYSPQLYLISTTSKYEVNGVVTVPEQHRWYSFSIEPMGHYHISLPYTVPCNTGGKYATIAVEADGDVVLYGYVAYSNYQDSFYGMPVHQLGVEYYPSTYTPNSVSYGNSIMLSAYLHDTNVLIYFNNPYTYNSVIYDRYNPFNITLYAYQTYMLEVPFDFTGTYVKSTKPVALVSGSTDSQLQGARETLLDFQAPVESWGTYFLVTNFRYQSTFMMRILARYNETLVTIETIGLNDTQIISLQPGYYHEESVPGGVKEVSSNNPIMVVQYMVSSNPTMVMIPPLDRAIKGPLHFVRVWTFDNYLTIWYSSTDKQGLLLNGASVTGSDIITDHGGWSIIQLTVSTDGNHILSHVDPDVRIVGIGYTDGYSYQLMYFTHEDNDIDDTPPFIYDCPVEPVVAESSRYSNNVSVYWNPPTSVDNSGLEVNNESSSTPGDSFPGGSTEVTYQFTDVSGNTATCVFEVIVKDFTAPDILHCPSDVSISTCAEQVEIYWREPIAFDDSGQNVTWNMSHSPGDQFPIGDTTVSYIFSDLAGNSAICNFIVSVGPKTCTSPSVVGLIVAMVVFSVAIITLIVVIALLCKKQITHK